MPNLRHERVRELLKRQIGEVIRREIPIEEAGLVNVNDVGVSGNLQSAVVYIGIVGSPNQQRRALELLDQHRGRIQTLVGQAVVLKYTPQLRFTLDDSIERGNRVMRILDELEAAGIATPAAVTNPAPAAVPAPPEAPAPARTARKRASGARPRSPRASA